MPEHFFQPVLHLKGPGLPTLCAVPACSWQIDLPPSMTNQASRNHLSETVTTKRSCITDSSFLPLTNQSVLFSAIIASTVVVVSIPVVVAVVPVIVVALIVAVITAIVPVVLIAVVPVEPVITSAVLDVTIPPDIIPAMLSYLYRNSVIPDNDPWAAVA